MDIFCFILTTNYYQTFFKVTVPILYYSTQTTGLKLELKGGENQWPGGGAMLENFIQSAANLVQLFI